MPGDTAVAELCFFGDFYLLTPFLYVVSLFVYLTEHSGHLFKFIQMTQKPRESAAVTDTEHTGLVIVYSYLYICII